VLVAGLVLFSVASPLDCCPALNPVCFPAREGQGAVLVGFDGAIADELKD
jgi:hypothetical protein